MLKFDYLPAIIKNNSHGWYVEFQVLDPTAGKMKRYRQQLNNLRKHYTRLSDFKEHCNQIVCMINAKLAGGWNPVGENLNVRLYTPISFVIRDYLEEKQAEVRIDTLRSYQSYCGIFGKWVEATAPNCQAVLFNKVLAIRYLDYCFKERGLKGRSWNNQLKAIRALFTWAVEKCYCKENPFAGIKTKREDEKQRVLVPHSARQKISAWCQEHNPGLLIVSHLVYFLADQAEGDPIHPRGRRLPSGALHLHPPRNCQEPLPALRCPEPGARGTPRRLDPRRQQ